MARKKRDSLFSVMLTAPPLFGVAAAAAIWVAVWVLFDFLHLPGAANSQLVQSVDHAIHQDAFRNLSWFPIIVCLAAALNSYFKRGERAALLQRQTGLESIRELSWQAFERLVAEAYQRSGYKVRENDQRGADGGIDLYLTKDGRLTLVQCKRWRSSSVGAAIVREMFGLLKHHGAAEVKIICVGHFTAEAKAFAKGKPIELVTGEHLAHLVRLAQSPLIEVPCPDQESPGQPTPELPCPACGEKMVVRQARQTRRNFFGCSTFPLCRGIRNLD